MSDDIKKAKNGEKQRAGHVSRRDFLKDAGLVVGAPAIGTIAVTGREASAQGKADKDQSEGSPTVTTVFPSEPRAMSTATGSTRSS